MSAGFNNPRCPECDKVIDLNEYVEMSATLVRGGVATSLGIEMYCATCWYELQEEPNGKEKKDGS